MVKRTITGFVMSIVMIPIIFLGGWFFTVLMMVLSYIAGFEVLNMMYKKHGEFKMLRFIAPIWNAFLIFSYPVFNCNLYAPIIVLFSGIAAFLALMVIRAKMDEKISVLLVFNYLYTGVLFFLLFIIRNQSMAYYHLFDSFRGFLTTGLMRFTYLLLVVVLSDIGAYTIGSLIGKHPLCPTISPKKTVEGAIGGLVFSTLVGVLIYFLSSKLLGIDIFIHFESLALEIILVIIITILLSISSMIGDLVASRLKRHYEIKDYGFIFPGHGGVMDRFDSTIFASLIMVIVLLLMVI